MRRNGEELPAIRADEQGSRRRGDPETAEAANLTEIAGRVRRKEPPAGDMSGRGQARQDAAALFNLGAPGMALKIEPVTRTIGADATDNDLAEHVVAHLEDVCSRAKGGYLEEDELADLQHLIRAAARMPDLLATTVRCERCAACLRYQAAKDATYHGKDKRTKALALAGRHNPCPPENRIPETVTASMRQSRTWERIAKDLCAYLRRQILALEEGSPEEEKWIRNRARVAVEMRREQGRIFGALADWRRGIAAAHRANRENIWTEHLKGVIYNNCPKHRSARWAELGDEDALVRFAFPDDVLYLRET